MRRISGIRNMQKDNRDRKQFTLSRMNKGLKDYATNLDKKSDANLRKLIKATDRLKKLEARIDRPVENARETLANKVDAAIAKESKKLEKLELKRQKLEEEKTTLTTKINDLTNQSSSIQQELDEEVGKETPDLYRVQELRKNLKNMLDDKSKLEADLEKLEARLGMCAIRETGVRDRTISRAQREYRKYNRRMQILGEDDLTEDFSVEDIDQLIDERLDEMQEKLEAAKAEKEPEPEKQNNAEKEPKPEKQNNNGGERPESKDSNTPTPSEPTGSNLPPEAKKGFFARIKDWWNRRKEKRLEAGKDEKQETTEPNSNVSPTEAAKSADEKVFQEIISYDKDGKEVDREYVSYYKEEEQKPFVPPVKVDEAKARSEAKAKEEQIDKREQDERE